MTITIENLQLSELVDSLRMQADDVFQSLKDEQLLNDMALKWYNHARFCTCRDQTGRLVGMIAFYANRPESGTAYIPHVYICEEYRGHGLFGKMFAETTGRLRKEKYKRVKLEVDRSNVKAQKAYLKSGFKFCPPHPDTGSYYMECLI